MESIQGDIRKNAGLAGKADQLLPDLGTCVCVVAQSIEDVERFRMKCGNVVRHGSLRMSALGRTQRLHIIGKGVVVAREFHVH